jgi:hypothetical protein
MPCSAKAFANAMMAALIVATAAKAGFGSRAALPEISTTVPLEAFRASHARIVSRRAPCSFRAMPSSHSASVISNKSIWGTAPAIFNNASILPKWLSVPWIKTSADPGSRKSRAQVNDAAPADSTALAVFLSSSSCLAARTTASKSRARRIAVARPMPWLAPVTIATDFVCMVPSSSAGKCRLCSFQNHVHHYVRLRMHRTVVHLVRSNLRAHPFRHITLCFRRDHAILLRQEIP